jgi:hypothetical protein
VEIGMTGKVRPKDAKRHQYLAVLGKKPRFSAESAQIFLRRDESVTFF